MLHRKAEKKLEMLLQILVTAQELRRERGHLRTWNWTLAIIPAIPGYQLEVLQAPFGGSAK